MDSYLYLLINLATISIPLLFSFEKRIKFYSKWKALFLAMTLTALTFLIWDEYFTKVGHWGFNSEYILGIRLGHLPLEEILFFFCIPYACMFTYASFKFLLPKSLKTSWASILFYIIAGLLLLVGLLNLDQAYTSWTFILTACFIPIAVWQLSKRQLTVFFISYLVLLIPFFIVNGLLTGSWISDQVVWYNDAEHLGIRVGTVPIVDGIYMLLMLLLNTVLFERFQKQ